MVGGVIYFGKTLIPKPSQSPPQIFPVPTSSTTLTGTFAILADDPEQQYFVYDASTGHYVALHIPDAVLRAAGGPATLRGQTVTVVGSSSRLPIRAAGTAGLDYQVIDVQMLTPSSPSPKADETASWKTYTDDQYKFSIQYPDVWYADKHGDMVYIDSKPIPSMGLTHGIATSLSIFIKSASKAEILRSNENIEVFDTSIAGIKGQKIVSIKPSNIDGTFETTYNLITKQFNYMLSFRNNDAQGTHNIVFDQILSTFKFTN